MALRRYVGLNVSSASLESSRSASALVSPYGVTGNSSASSATPSEPGRTVETARRSEKEALDTGPLGRPSQVHGAIEIDREGGRRVEMAERVIGQGGQAGHGVVAGQVVRFGLAHVNRKAPADVFRSRAEVTTLVQAEVKAVYVVPGPAQEGNENGSDVATITRNKDPHRMPLVHIEKIGSRSLDRRHEGRLLTGARRRELDTWACWPGRRRRAPAVGSSSLQEVRVLPASWSNPLEHLPDLSSLLVPHRSVAGLVHSDQVTGLSRLLWLQAQKCHGPT